VIANIDIESTGLDAYSGHGGWNDPCLLLSADHDGVFAITEIQSRAQFSMWAIMASPLIISGNIRQISSFNLETYLNQEVINVNQVLFLLLFFSFLFSSLLLLFSHSETCYQDVLGKQGRRISGGFLNSTNTNVWGRQIADGYALVFLNIGPTATNITCDSACLGALPGVQNNMVLLLRDLWAHKAIGTIMVSDGYTAANVGPEGGILMLTAIPQEY